MKELKDYIRESILDDIDDQIENTDEVIKNSIRRFIDNNYVYNSIEISYEPNRDGKYEVSSKGNVVVKNKHITLLTNSYFVFTEVRGDFKCGYCKSLKSLEGAPKKVGSFSCEGCKSLKSLEGCPEIVEENFKCSDCNSLISLKGAPKKVGAHFECSDCNSLISLEGAPEKVDGDFWCFNCNSLISLEGAPKEVRNTFNCRECTSLKSLEGAPKKVGGNFCCYKCGTDFTEDDVKKVSNVKCKIYCK